MPPRLWLQEVKRILEFYYSDEMSMRRIARIMGIGPSTVSRTISRARLRDITWPLPEWATDDVLRSVLWPKSAEGRKTSRLRPNWAAIYQELSQNSQLSILDVWRDYIKVHPDGYRYSRFCDHYRLWRVRNVDPDLYDARRTKSEDW